MRGALTIDLPQDASGLSWYEADAGSVMTKEVISKELAEVLKTQTEFTQDEWKCFGIAELSGNHFIKSDGKFFKPVEDNAEWHALLQRYDTRGTLTLDKQEWRALLQDTVVDPGDFKPVSVNKLSRDILKVREKVGALSQLLESAVAKRETQFAQLHKLVLDLPPAAVRRAIVSLPMAVPDCAPQAVNGAHTSNGMGMTSHTALTRRACRQGSLTRKLDSAFDEKQKGLPEVGSEQETSMNSLEIVLNMDLDGDGDVGLQGHENDRDIGGSAKGLGF